MSRHFRPIHGFAFAAGAASVLVFAQLPGTAWLGALVAAAVGAIWIRQGAFAAALLGFVLAAGTGQQRLADRLDPALEGQDLALTGHVVGLPQRDARSVRFDFAVQHPAAGVPQRLRLSWYEGAPELTAGDCLRISARLKRPRGLVNPAGFDFERYALAARIGATGYVAGTGQMDAGCTRRMDVDRWRQAIAQTIDGNLQPGRQRATLKALAIGDTRELDDQAWDLFRATGTTHLIAISGLHVGLAAALGGGLVWCVYWLFPWLGLRWPRPVSMAIGALLSASAYALLAGFSLPTQRTLITIAAMLAGVLTRRELGWWTRYALALVAVLLIDPLAPLSPGFWLSFGAVAWLILAFGERWAPLPLWRAWLWPQLGLSIALLPLGLAFFQQTSLAAPLVNLIAVPYVTFIIVPVLLLALACWPIAPLSAALFALAWWLLGAFDALVLTAADWPAARWAMPAPGAIAWSLALLGTLWMLAPRGFPGRALGAFALLPLFLPPRETIPAGGLDMTLLDVGQGQAVLVQTAGHTLLIDTGPGFPDGGDLGDRVLAPALVQLGVRGLDRLIVSHDDLDHAGGTASLRRRLPIDAISTSAPAGIPGSTLCETGQKWVWDSVEFEILHPPATLPYLDNDSSCIVRIRSPGGTLLIPGDASELIETRLLREQGARLDADVLIAGHHGSKSSSGRDFLHAVSPDWVLYSAGWRNRYGFPRPEVRERVAALHARELNTADEGAIRLRLRAGTPIETESWRLREPRWWREGGG